MCVYIQRVRQRDKERETVRKTDRTKNEGRQMMSKLWAEKVSSGSSRSSVSVHTMTISVSAKHERTRQSDITKKNIIGKNSCQNISLIKALGFLQMQERTSHNSFSTELHLL